MSILLGILGVPSTALFWTEISDVVSGIFWSHSSSVGVTAPSDRMTTGTTVVFTPHILPNCSLRFWYFHSFLWASSWCCCWWGWPHLSLHPFCLWPQCPHNVRHHLLVSPYLEVHQDLSSVEVCQTLTWEFPVQTWYRCSCTLYYIYFVKMFHVQCTC